jgi:hypothetical protein
LEGLALSRSTVVGACDRAGNPFDLMVATTSGERIRSMFGLDAGIQLDAATLNRGEKAKSAVIFDVPKTGVVGIAYAPGGQMLGTWKL